MFSDFKIIFHQGKQYIPNLKSVELPGKFRGRPVITNALTDTDQLADVCPSHAITVDPVRIDLGKCLFCGECSFAFPDKIKFTNDYRISSNYRDGLIVREGYDLPVTLDASVIRKEIHTLFRRSIKLRQVSAGGDNSCEWELNATNNVNFDMGRFGIDFVASPRHADGLVITGPITKHMALPLQACYDAMPDPKILILAGTDAISGGIFADNPALDRRFLNDVNVDLYIPGNPVHPLTFINGVLELIKIKTR
jgi:Ni,Fe-hydrogenase III small subunit